MRLCPAGEIKRWNHHRGPMSHGSKSHRLHGSTGASATPNRTFPGQKMSGHMGDKRIKCRKLKVSHIQSALGLCLQLVYCCCTAAPPAWPWEATLHASFREPDLLQGCSAQSAAAAVASCMPYGANVSRVAQAPPVLQARPCDFV